MVVNKCFLGKSLMQQLKNDLWMELKILTSNWPFVHWLAVHVYVFVSYGVNLIAIDLL